MHHGKSEILRDLDPSNPATVQALVDFHRETFGGWKMEGEGDDPKPNEGGDKSDDKGGEAKDDKKSDDKPLGPNGEKALQAERDARKQLESDFGQFKAGLASLLGLEKDAKSSTDDVLATVQQQLATMQRDNLVLSLANTNKITDEDDLGLLRTFKGDEDGLRKLAARLKPSETQEQTNGRKRTPAPDPSQGQGSGSGGGRSSSVAQVMAERAAARAAKSK